MSSLRLLAAALAFAVCLSASARAPAPLPKRERAPALPVGHWTVRFDNGVVQSCEVRQNGAAHVVEPQRNSGGTATLRGRAVVIICDDDRAERWTPSGKQMVVEHWFPASAYPDGRAVRGVAERAR